MGYVYVEDALMDLKPHKKKVFGRMQRMYEYWQEKKVQEKWPQELLALKEYSLGAEREDLYLFAVVQFLALMAREEDMDTFIWLLEREEYPWFSLQTFFEDDMDALLIIYGKLMEELP